MLFYDEAGQSVRRKEVLNRICDVAIAGMTSDFNWEPLPDSLADVDISDVQQVFRRIGDKAYIRVSPQVRGWIASAFVNAEREELYSTANEIWRDIGTNGQICGSFVIRTIIPTLMDHPEAIAADVQDLMREAIARHNKHVLSENVAFQGINDNFPSMDMACAILGGHMLGDTKAYEKGLLLLSQQEDMFSRRGLASEYTSPNYVSIALSPVADVAKYAPDPEVRRRALACEERMMLDLCAHYHPETCQMAGPYSRTYMVDCCGHTNGARQLYYLLFGDKTPVNIMNTLLTGWKGAEGEIMHNSCTYMIGELASHARSTYHLPAYLADLALNKTYPFEFYATCDSRDRIDIAPEPTTLFPGGKNAVYTYMTQNYAIGFGASDFSTGVQTNLAHLLYRRRPVTSQADIGTIFCKYNINNMDPNTAHYGKHPYPGGFSAAVEHYLDQGRKLGIYSHNTGMLLYKPKLWARSGCTSLTLDIMMPCHYGPPENIWLGNKKVDLSGDGVLAESTDVCQILIQDGPVFAGIVPILPDNLGRNAAVRITRRGKFLIISLINYEGDKRDFSDLELHCARSGFVLEVRDETESRINEMQKLLSSWSITSKIKYYDQYPSMCDVLAQRPGLSFALSYSPINESVMYRTVNKTELPEPVLYCTGLDEKVVPFYSERWAKLF